MVTSSKLSRVTVAFINYSSQTIVVLALAPTTTSMPVLATATTLVAAATTPTKAAVLTPATTSRNQTQLSQRPS